MKWTRVRSITQRALPAGVVLLIAASMAGGTVFGAGNDANAEPRQQFREAWAAARRGDHSHFARLGPGLESYVLYPYLQYEDYRHRRERVAPAEMSAFLDAHADWAFAAGLRQAWQLSLARKSRWQDLLDYEYESANIELKCLYARARLALGHTDGLLAEARSLWLAGRSQPKPCDPVFDWLIDQGGVTTELAWERIRLAMQSGNPRFTLYLARFLPRDERRWLERWQEFNRTRYRTLESAATWPDTPATRMITSVSLQRLSHYDAVAAMHAFRRLDGHFGWGSEKRGDVLREIALMAAVELNPEGLDYMRLVPPDQRTEQLLQWWVRLGLALQAWPQVLEAIGQLGPESAGDDQWRYWRARAWWETGQRGQAVQEYASLATNASYFGFLAADRIGQPYTICPQEPPVSDGEVHALRAADGFRRALELREAGMGNWALAEWDLAVRRLPVSKLKVAAALALQEDWHDRAIFALGDSGDLRYYAWRFPILWAEQVRSESSRHGLDPAWILSVMRSESAMTESARSAAGALGLMQVMPATARQLGGTHGLRYRNEAQLLTGEENIRFGAAYMRDLADRFGHNPVLISGAYNAGPEVVERWLSSRDIEDPAIWVETLPYYETRDYIPRVLAFTAIYDWRLQNPVRRVSSRMPGIESGNMEPVTTTEVVCRAPQAGLAAATP